MSLHGEDDVRHEEELEGHAPDEPERGDPKTGEAKDGDEALPVSLHIANVVYVTHPDDVPSPKVSGEPAAIS
jgi:hypothetical protein